MKRKKILARRKAFVTLTGMTSEKRLEFHCLECETPILFSVLDSEQFSKILTCPCCEKKYAFDDETLLKHLKQFEALCQQIHASKDILGSTSIAIDVGTHHVNVPFNILLTRLSSVIDLKIDDQNLTIAFRVEPLNDLAQLC